MCIGGVAERDFIRHRAGHRFGRCRNHHSIALGCCGREVECVAQDAGHSLRQEEGRADLTKYRPLEWCDIGRPLNEELQPGRRACIFLGDRWPPCRPLLETRPLLPRPYLGVRAFRAARLSTHAWTYLWIEPPCSLASRPRRGCGTTSAGV